MTLYSPRNTKILTMMLAVIVAANALIFHNAIGHVVSGITGGRLASPAGYFSGIRAYVSRMVTSRDLAVENLWLSEELTRVRAQIADVDALRQELALARVAAEIHNRIDRQSIEAGLVVSVVETGIRMAIINRGTRDGISANNIVITAAGALVGVVREVFPDHAVVLMVGDPGLQVTGRIPGTTITGLVRFDATDGLILDLVHKDESVTEGQVVATSGNDQFPPALIIGTIRSVNNQQTSLFSLVRLTSAAEDRSGRVLVLMP